MTRQEIAEGFRNLFTELHASIEEEPEGQRKRRAIRLAKLMHGAANELYDLAVGDNEIVAFSGGEPKPE